jgi:hypothetical protein
MARDELEQDSMYAARGEQDMPDADAPEDPQDAQEDLARETREDSAAFDDD